MKVSRFLFCFTLMLAACLAPNVFAQATLPISAKMTNNTTAWTNLTGWSGNGIGIYADGDANFSDKNDSLRVNFDSAPGNLTFDLQGRTSSAGTAPMAYAVEESADGLGWSQVDSIDETEISTSVTAFGPYALNSASRYVRWTYTNKFAFNIGLNNVGITSGGPAMFQVTLNKADGFTVEQGSSDAITATAANGTPPYTYGWASTLGGAYYTTNANVFTILSTAPTGSYSATVTATDNAALTTNKMVSFSVVAAPTKYAITITPSVNGSVTTTPATNATAGATVTIHATPDADYVVDTMSVVDSAANPVALVGNTFTMPALAVTVTVTFKEKPVGVAGLIISQYYEGASNNKWIELFNASDASIDLAAGGYRLGQFSNTNREAWKSDATPSLMVVLTNTIAAGATYLISHGSAVLPAYATANQTAGWGFNGDDSVILYTGTPYAFANVVDAFGLTGNTAADTSFVRTNTVTSGVNTDFNAAEWIEFSLAEVEAATPDTNVRLGYHSTVGSAFSVSMNKVDGFTVEQGTSDAITATAANGTAPYTYGWASTLGGAYYTTNANVFTILSTAPTGSYSATVTATDNAALSTNKSVSFSVVAAPTKYAITITPPVNGTVTTTPATNAVAGATVTINAMPNGGYAVDTITVVDSAANPVPVTGNTFTMPALAVTVTVTFEPYVGPDVLIDFETNTTLSASTYAPGTSTVNNIGFSHTNVLRGNADNDRKHGLYAGRFRQITGTNAVLSTTAAFAEPITKISFWYANYGSDNSVTFKVQVSSDGSTWQDVGTGYDPEDTNLVEAVIDSIPAGMTYFQFITTAGTSGNRMNVDDIGLYFGSTAFQVTVNRTNGFTVTQGSSGTIIATAANGTPPYTYGWVSTLGGAYYTTNANVFTILSTAPTGSYSATVTATDSSGTPQSTNTTVTFSVVSAGAAPVIGTFKVLAGSTASATINPSVLGKIYVLQYTTALAAIPVVWTPADTEPGTGGVITLADATMAGVTRIYRIIEQDP